MRQPKQFWVKVKNNCRQLYNFVFWFISNNLCNQSCRIWAFTNFYTSARPPLLAMSAAAKQKENLLSQPFPKGWQFRNSDGKRLQNLFLNTGQSSVSWEWLENFYAGLLLVRLRKNGLVCHIRSYFVDPN